MQESVFGKATFNDCRFQSLIMIKVYGSYTYGSSSPPPTKYNDLRRDGQLLCRPVFFLFFDFATTTINLDSLRCVPAVPSAAVDVVLTSTLIFSLSVISYY